MTDRDTRKQSVSLVLVVDRSVCAGHGMCYGRAPDVVDCDDSGYPVLLHEVLELDGHIAAAEEAVAVCPERALRLEST